MYIEKLRSLMEKAPGEAADIAEYAQMLTKYVNTVADQVLATERNRAFLISERIDQTEYIARIERANDERNKAHDKACAACKNINDIAARNGKQKIFDFEPQIETIVGDVIFHLWEIRETLNITISIRSYLIKAVRNRCIDYLKSGSEKKEFHFQF